MINKKYHEINIPENIDIEIDNGVQRAELEKEIIKNKKKRKAVGTIAVSLVAILTVGIVNPAFAAKIPIVGNVFEAVEKNLFFPGRYAQYATSINETAYSNGIGVTLAEIFSDGQFLYVSYIVESDEPFKYTTISIDERDGEIIKKTQLGFEDAYSHVDFANKNLEVTGMSGLDGEFIDDNTFVGVQQYDLTSLNTTIPDEFVFKTKKIIIENDADNIKDESLTKWGTWAFKVPVKVNKELSNVIEVEKINENGVGINTISLTPYTTIINATIKNYNRDEYFYEMNAYDNFGNQLLYRSLKLIEEDKVKGIYTTTIDEMEEIRVVITRQASKLSDEGKEIILDTVISVN